MFFDFGAGELIGLAILAMILIGPERLPNFAVDAAKFVKRIREMASKATEELKENLGPGFEDLDVSDLTPKNLAKKVLGNAMDDVKPVAQEVKRQSKEIKDVAKIDPDLL